MNTYTEDHLVEQPAFQLMQHELGLQFRVAGEFYWRRTIWLIEAYNSGALSIEQLFAE